MQNEPNAGLHLANARANAGATQIDGIGYYAEVADCDYPSEGADFALRLTGDLEGCLYVFVESYECSPSGSYRESGREHFVGTYNRAAGSFWTTYKFEARFEGCAEDGSFIGAEIFGRCQHPIESGSGAGVFEGVKGRLDFKDDIASGTFPYRGTFGTKSLKRYAKRRGALSERPYSLNKADSVVFLLINAPGGRLAPVLSSFSQRASTTSAIAVPTKTVEKCKDSDFFRLFRRA